MAIALGFLLQHAKEPLVKPASVPVSSCPLDHMYRVQQAGAKFLFAHLKPNSVIGNSALKSRKQHSTLNDNERKKMKLVESFTSWESWASRP